MRKIDTVLMCLRTHYKLPTVSRNVLLNSYLCIYNEVSHVSLQCCNNVFVSVVCVSCVYFPVLQLHTVKKIFLYRSLLHENEC